MSLKAIMEIYRKSAIMITKNIQLPKLFLERLFDIVPHPQYDNILKTFAQKKPVTFRINTLKTDGETILQTFKPKPVPYFSNAYQLPADSKQRLTQSSYFLNGEIYIQNLSSMLAPLILNPQPHDEILDLTAAPGSKTTQIAMMINNQGRIAAVEKSKSRFFKLKRVCQTQGAHYIDFYCKDGASVWRSCENRFDKILLDAPCSSEARFNLNKPESFQYWSDKKIKEMARKQWPLLYSAFRSLKPGGILVYSTCSFAPEENEMQISKLIKKFGTLLEIESIELPISNTQPGIITWNSKTFTNKVLKTRRILPTNLMDGFFLCRIKKLS